VTVNHILSALVQAISARQPAPGTTLNPSGKGSNVVLSNANLTLTVSSGEGSALSTTSLSTGKVYFEVTWNTPGSGSADTAVGIANSSFRTAKEPGYDDGGNAIGALNNNEIAINSSSKGNWSIVSANDVTAFAVDLGNTLFWAKDITESGNWNANGSANPATGVGGITFSSLGAGPFFVAIGAFPSGTGQLTVNFGATSFTGTVPSGFSAWG
jgi:hypothetical protein